MGIIDRLFPENDEGSLGKIVKVSDRGGEGYGISSVRKKRPGS